MREDVAMHGFPHEHEGPLSGWAAVRDCLVAIAESDCAVRVSVGPSIDVQPLEVRGKLKRFGSWSNPASASFAINTAGSREEGGLFSLGQAEFRGAELRSYDGDDYFHLSIQMGRLVFLLRDTNSL
jgi:hypothetical protein